MLHKLVLCYNLGVGSLEFYNKTAPDRDKRIVLCCICGRAPVHYALDYNGNSIARCPDCRLRFVSPRADISAFLDHVYDDKYYASDIPATEVTKGAEHYLDRLQRIKSPPGLLLDIGAAEGFLLAAAAKRGWDIEGIDIQPKQVESIRRKLGCTMHTGFIENLTLESRYDAITLTHVLEHTINPTEFLAKCRTLLKPGGIVYAVFPNTASLNDRIKTGMSRWHLKSRPWKHFAADHHLWFFTPATVRRLVAKIDFPVLSLKTIYAQDKMEKPFSGMRRALAEAGLGAWIEMILQRRD